MQAPSEGEMRGTGRTRPTGKVKGKVTEEKANMKAKGEGFGSKGFQQSVKEADEEDERVRMAPNMGAGGSHPRATSDPGRER